MKEFVKKYLNQRNRNIISIFIIMFGVGYLINYSLFTPSYVNKYIGYIRYKSAASDSGFEDVNFYKCVVDAYNRQNKTSLGYNTVLNSTQLNTIIGMECNNTYSASDDVKIKSTKGLEKLTNLKFLELDNNLISEINLKSNTKLLGLSLYKNKLTSIDLTGHEKLYGLNLDFNRLKSLDLSNFNNIMFRFCPSDVSVGNIANGYISTSGGCPYYSSIDSSYYGEELYAYKGSDVYTNSTVKLSQNILKTWSESENGKMEWKSSYYNVSNIVIDDKYKIVTKGYLRPSSVGDIIVTGELSDCKVSNGTKSCNSKFGAHKSVSTIHVIGITSNKYFIDESNGVVYIGTDAITNDIKNSINVSNNNVTLDVDISNKKLFVKYSNQILKEFKIANVSSSKYQFNDNKIYLNEKFDINNISAINCTKEFENGNLIIKNNSVIYAEIPVIGYFSNVYNLNNNYIDCLGSSFSIDNIEVYNIQKEVINNKLIIKYNDEVLKEYDIVSYTSSKYDLRKNNIVLIGEEIDLNSINTINCTKELISDKLVFKYKNNIIKEITITNVNSSKYSMDNEVILIYGDTDVDVIKNNIRISSNDITVDVNMNNYILKIKRGDTVLKEYDIINITSSKYGVTKSGIYIGDNEFNINDINVLNGNKKLENNKLVISYNGVQIKSLSIINSELEEDYVEFNNNVIVDDNNKIIDKIKHKTTVDGIRNIISTNGNVSIFDKNNNKITDNNKKIGTGYKVKIEGSNQVYEYLISVKGDPTGDGEVNVRDIVDVANTIVKNRNLDKVYYSASDYHEDNTINVRDIVGIANYIVNGK